MSDDDKFSLMETIIAALDEKLWETNGVPPRAWKEIKKRLLNNKELHRYTIMYWSEMYFGYYRLSEANDVASLMRGVLRKL